MATMIKSLYLNATDYGPNKGRLTGTLKIANGYGEFELNITQEQAEQIVALVAGAVVSAAKEVSSLMTADVLEQAGVPALEA